MQVSAALLPLRFAVGWAHNAAAGCRLLSVQGEADSALDHLWTKKRAEIGQ